MILFFCLPFLVGVVIFLFNGLVLLEFHSRFHAKKIERKPRKQHLGRSMEPIIRLELKASKFVSVLHKLCDLLVRDFLDFWYRDGITQERDFQNEVKEVMLFALCQLGNQGSKVDWLDFFSEKVLKILTNTLELYQHTLITLSRDVPNFATLSPSIQDGLVLKHIQENFSLHVASQGIMQEKEYLHKWCSKLALELTRESDHGCKLARVFLEDLLTECVMYPCIGFVDPYYVNYGINVFMERLTSIHSEDEFEPGETTLTREMSEKQQLEEEQLLLSDHELDSRRSIDGCISSRESIAEIPKTNAAPEQSKANSPGITGFFGSLTRGIFHKKSKKPVIADREEPNCNWFRILHGKEKKLVRHNLVKPRVHIVKNEIAFDSGHKAYVIYLLEVTDEDGQLRWLVGKRYSQFHQLHAALTEKGIHINSNLPPRKLFWTLTEKFITQRRRDLQSYIETLLWSRKIVQSEEFREFLIPNEWVTKVGAGLTSGLTKKRKTRRKDIATRQRASSDHPDEDCSFGVVWDRNPASAKAICKLLTVACSFEPDFIFRQNATKFSVLLGQQLFSGYASRAIASWYSNNFATEDTAVKLIDWLIDTLWPKGVWKESAGLPSEKEITEEKEKAFTHLPELRHQILPETCSTLLGDQYTLNCTTKVWRFCQSNLLLKHFIYCVADELLDVLFPLKTKRKSKEARKKKRREVVARKPDSAPPIRKKEMTPRDPRLRLKTVANASSPTI